AVEAMAAVGMPDGRPFYFAVDWDVTPEQWPAVLDYFRGAASILTTERVGIYAVRWAVRDRAASWFFQTYAWSKGQWYPGNHIEQYRNGVSLVGGDVD